MTVLFGVFGKRASDPGEELSRQANALARIGPDSPQIWTDGEVGLGLRLYALLPEDRRPDAIHIVGRRYAVVADVHLSEREDLVRRLGLDGELLSDAGVVAAALERWDENAFAEIYGVFAIAAWDLQERRLLLARDHLGERPLFYRGTQHGLIFASMPEGINAVVSEAPSLDEKQYLRLLRSLPLSPQATLQAGVKRVMPGHFVVASTNGIESFRWWKPELTPLRLPEQKDYEAHLAMLLEKAVSASLRGVTNVAAAHLSGGFDSTTVVAIAARQLADRNAGLLALTAVPKSGQFGLIMKHHVPDEGDLAAETAALYSNIEHVRVATDRGTLDNLDRSASIYTVPVRNLCNLAWGDAINDEVRRRGVKVLLQGSRGNLSISESGVLALHELARGGRLATWFSLASGLVRNGWMSWPGVLWNTFSAWIPLPIWRWAETRTGRAPISARRFSLLKQETYDAVLEEARAEHDPADRFDVVDFEEWSNKHVFSLDNRLAMLNDDIGSFSKAQLGEWGIDLRDPTADRRLIEFALRVPVERLVWGGEPRAILRAVMAGRAPSAVLDARKKGLQAADWHKTLTASRERLLEEIERIEMFDPSAAMIDLDQLKALAANLPDIDSPDWQGIDAELDYRYGLLRTVSVASHMRKTVRSNY